METRIKLALWFVCALGLVACGPVATPTLSPGLDEGLTEVVEPMIVNAVQVIGTQGTPPQPAAAIEGTIGDACNTLESITQSRDGNTISLQINVRRTTGPNVACAEIAQLFSETIPLDGAFPPGDYSLVVNGSAVAFTVEDGAAAPVATATIAPAPTSPAATGNCTPDAEFVRDVNVPDGSPIAGGAPFVKTWLMQNNGTCAWDETYVLVKIEGDTISFAEATQDAIPLPDVLPGQEAEISAQLVMSLEVPLESVQSARFRLRAPNGELFGEQPFVEVTASEASGADCSHDATFVEDVTIPDGSPMAPNKPFIKTWRVLNSGNCAWTADFEMVQTSGSSITPTSGSEVIALPPTQPGQEATISVELSVSVETPVGSQQTARFGLRTPEGTFFGTEPFVVVTIAES